MASYMSTSVLAVDIYFLIYFFSLIYVTEWHRVIMAAGADEVRKWPVQIRHPDCHSSSSIGGTGSSSDMGLMTDRGLGLAGSGPTSPSPSSSSFGGRGKSSHYSKPGADLSSGMNRRQNQATNQMAQSENAIAAFKWVHSISLVSVRADQSLQIVSTTDGMIFHLFLRKLKYNCKQLLVRIGTGIER